jgi:pterin-4a-carbinolamine dehydratase
MGETMNAEEFIQSIEYAKKIAKLLENEETPNIKITYTSFIMLICAHVLGISNIKYSTDNVTRLASAIDKALEKEVGQMISEKL